MVIACVLHIYSLCSGHSDQGCYLSLSSASVLAVVVVAVVVCSSNYIELPVELLASYPVLANNWLSTHTHIERKAAKATPLRAACLSVSSQRVV